MHASIWIAALAQPIVIHNWIAAVLIIPACAALSFLCVTNEKTMMREAFGVAYDDASEVGSLLPRFWH
ncbi:MAG: isoprenylcysteine carboxylmethyltransferase family protein [Pseudolabrys sp.]|nr:isoprenylcysteine carboxylmethyltransferase family protein [Pseudolabrys sp.]